MNTRHNLCDIVRTTYFLDGGKRISMELIDQRTSIKVTGETTGSMHKLERKLYKELLTCPQKKNLGEV